MTTALKQLSRISLASVTNLAKTIQVVWTDGVRAEFPYCWLRDATARPSLIHTDVSSRPKAIECSSSSLRVMWPPFLTYSFSSEFLREHATSHPSKDECTSESSGEQLSVDLSKTNLHLKEQLWTVVPNRMKIDENLIMGSFEWRERAQEPGTIWPHLDIIPSLYIVDTLNGPANFTLVDSFRALTLLQEICPSEFKSLTTNFSLEYSEGLFRARHPICTRSIENGKIIESAVFNNALRSSVITIDAIHKLESLHKFGRICAELATTITLNPGERLIVNNKKLMLGAPAQKKRHVIFSVIS